MNKVVCLIDSFNSGGAQKQMMLLANGLIKNKFKVATLQYHNLNFWGNYLDKRILRLKSVHKSKFIRTFKIMYSLYIYNPKYIISFLHIPNNYALLYKIMFFWRSTVLITSERNLNINTLGVKDLLIRIPHLFASKVVCNSNLQKLKIENYFKKNIIFIPNGTSTSNITLKSNYESKNKKLKLIVPARFSLQKNPINLLKAIKIILTNSNLSIEIHWYGRTDSNELIYKDSIEFIKKNNLDNNFFFKSPSLNIFEKIIKYDAVILPSFYEGCPNAIIDGMLCASPILASDVSDNRVYLKHQEEFLFNPICPKDIADKIHAFSKKNTFFRQQLGNDNRIFAEKMFDIDKMINSYIKLLLK